MNFTPQKPILSSDKSAPRLPSASRELVLQLINQGILRTPPHDPSAHPKVRYDLTSTKSGGSGFNSKAEEPEALDQLKTRIKARLGRNYTSLVSWISPVMPRLLWPRFQSWNRTILSKYDDGKSIMLQLGSGNARLNPRMINLDLRNFEEVDIVADGSQLPFQDGAVDVIYNSAVLEHVENPEAFLKEAHRVLKTNGVIITGVPFLQGFHGSPDDFSRWTHRGLKAIHERNGFRVEKMELLGGPTSGLLWILQEWLAIVLSLGNSRLHFLILLVLTPLTAPFKLLDLVLVHHPAASRIASSHACIARKT